MSLLCSIAKDIIATILSAGILALILYIFKGKIKRIFSGNDLFPASKIPVLEIDAYNYGLIEENGVKNTKGLSITLSNEGEIGVSDIRVFYYKQDYNHVKNEYKMSAKLLINGISHQWSNLRCGECAGISIEGFADHLSNNPQEGMLINFQEGILIEMVDEHNIIFCQNLHVYKNEKGNIDLLPQTIKRLKRKLPKKINSRDLEYVGSKYGVDITVG